MGLLRFFGELNLQMVLNLDGIIKQNHPLGRGVGRWGVQGLKFDIWLWLSFWLIEVASFSLAFVYCF